jgi:serine/threonine protein kinase
MEKSMIKIIFVNAGVIFYKNTDYLGKGAFAKCYKAVDEKKNEYALKIIEKKSKNSNNSINEERMMNEINIHKL